MVNGQLLLAQDSTKYFFLAMAKQQYFSSYCFQNRRFYGCQLQKKHTHQESGLLSSYTAFVNVSVLRQQ